MGKGLLHNTIPITIYMVNCAMNVVRQWVFNILHTLHFPCKIDSGCTGGTCVHADLKRGSSRVERGMHISVITDT